VSSLLTRINLAVRATKVARPVWRAVSAASMVTGHLRETE